MDFLSRQRGPESVENIPDSFPDECPWDGKVNLEGFPLPGPRDKEISVFQTSEDDPEFHDVRKYLMTGDYPEGLSREEKIIFQHRVAPYTMIREVLFRIGPDDQLRRCLETKHRKRVIRELHEGPAGGHFAVVATVARIRAAGYWWPHLHRDVKLLIRGCDPCQRSGNPTFRNHWPLTPIIPLAPFEKWGIDFIGPIFPVSFRKNRYIILATDYATKWVEAKATRRNDAETSAEFIFENIIMRFGYPLELVSDRGTHFLNEVIANLTRRYHIKHRKTTPYNPKANGLTERANGIVGKVLSKVVSAHKTDWDRKLCSVVFAYNTTRKVTTGRSPYYLVFGQEVVQEVETAVESFRILAIRNADRDTNLQSRFDDLDTLEEERRESLDSTRILQAKRKETFDRKLPKDTGIREGSLVLMYDSRQKDFPGKLQTRWVGPFKVSKVYENGSLQLTDLQGRPLDTRTNGSRVKLYNPELDDSDVREDAHI